MGNADNIQFAQPDAARSDVESDGRAELSMMPHAAPFGSSGRTGYSLGNKDEYRPVGRTQISWPLEHSNGEAASALIPQIAVGALMFKHVALDSARRAPLGAVGAFIVQTVLRMATALGQTAAGPKIKIGIIGAGHIGSTIGELWVKANHPVFFSSRHPEELKDLAARLGALA
jgi:F420-dependent NADP oxidoreductase-like protein